MKHDTLALYIHWPFCKAKCPYCDFNSHVRESVDEQAWQAALLAEMAYMAEHVPGKPVASIFFGGGTPSLMPPKTAEALIHEAERLWGCVPGVEITLEANPTSVEASRFAGFRAAGVNRVSLGVQAMDDASLAFLGRKHSAAEALVAVETAARLFPRYSFDLIYARPNQTEAQWREELTRALDFADGHLSLYQLTIEENTAFYTAHARGDFVVPEEHLAADLYILTQEMMESAGLPAYEVSNHARPGQESLHNLAYWQGADYVGIGPGAHGRLTINDGRVATQTLKSPERWLSSVQSKGHGAEVWQALSLEETREEQLMMRLRLTTGLDRALVPWIREHTLKSMAAEGALRFDDHEIQLTLQGRLVLNYVTARLLAA